MHERSGVGVAAAGRGTAEPYPRLSPGPGRSPAAVEADQRERIQRALAELVAEVGYRTATVRRVARLAGVSTETFYELYDGKDDLLVSAYTALMERCRTRVEPPCARGRNGRFTRRLALRDLLDALLADPAAARLGLVDVFAGGPAALDRVRAEEVTLAAALERCLDHGGQKASPLAVAWVVAGTLHCARLLLDSVPGAISPGSTRRLLRWGRDCLVEPEPGLAGRGGDPAVALPGLDDDLEQVTPSGEETDLVVNAVFKLSRADGYWRLSEPQATRAAGIPATHFKRHFSDLDEAYLFALERAALRLFSGFGRLAEDGGDWKRALCEQVAALSATLAADPRLASLVFSGILPPGTAGLTRRKALIGELAVTWRDSVPAGDRPAILVARASIAALWSAFARAAELGEAEQLPDRAPTHAYLILAPAVGADEAADAVTEFLAMTRGSRVPERATYAERRS